MGRVWPTSVSCDSKSVEKSLIGLGGLLMAAAVIMRLMAMVAIVVGATVMVAWSGRDCVSGTCGAGWAVVVALFFFSFVCKKNIKR